MGEGEHRCIHETDWVITKEHIHDIALDLKMVLKTLRGNGEPGLLTKLALQEQCLKKLHDGLDYLIIDLDKMKSRSEICIGNDKSISRIWNTLGWVGGPTTVILWAGIIKYMFFGV